MKLTAWEEERLLIFTAAELARRHRDRGLLLNAPEATAIICDAMLEAARAGGSYAEVEAAGRAAVTGDDVLPGVAALVPEVILEVLMDDGTRLVVLHEPHQEISIVARGTVETRDRAGVARGLAEIAPARVYKRETPKTAPDQAIRELSASIAGKDPLARMHNLMDAVHERVA